MSKATDQISYDEGVRDGMDEVRELYHNVLRRWYLCSDPARKDEIIRGLCEMEGIGQSITDVLKNEE